MRVHNERKHFVPLFESSLKYKITHNLQQKQVLPEAGVVDTGINTME